MMIGPGDLAALIKAVGQVVESIRAGEASKRLAEWATMMREPDTEDRAHRIRQFLQDRTQDRGFTPFYSYEQGVAVPRDLLCDLVDLLVMGARPAGGMLAWLGLGRGTEKLRREWAALVRSGNRAAIIGFLSDRLTEQGRARDYAGDVQIIVDVDWLADAGMYLLS